MRGFATVQMRFEFAQHFGLGDGDFVAALGVLRFFFLAFFTVSKIRQHEFPR